MASGATLFILKRIGNWKTSSFSFSKRATFTLQTAIIRLILKKVILWWNQKWFHQIESQFFWNHCGFTRYFELLGGIFFSAWFQRRKIAVFWLKFTISRVSKKTDMPEVFENQIFVPQMWIKYKTVRRTSSEVPSHLVLGIKVFEVSK